MLTFESRESNVWLSCDHPYIVVTESNIQINTLFIIYSLVFLLVLGGDQVCNLTRNQNIRGDW